MSEAAAAPQGGAAADLPYRLAWRTSAIRSGAHRSSIEGAGGLFRDHVQLLRAPDPRRIDLRASIRDPFGTLYVKRFEQKSAITLYALVDLSASMAFSDGESKLAAAAEICAALAASSRRIGDKFGLIGAGPRIVPSLDFPATRSRGGEAEMIRALKSFPGRGRGAGGLIDAAGQIAGSRKLVFVISDFYLPLKEIETLFQSLSGHDVVPVMLRDEVEAEALPSFGLLTLRDLESGNQRLLFMRPSYRQRLIDEAAERERQLRAIMSRTARPPLVLSVPIDWQRVTQYLMGEAA